MFLFLSGHSCSFFQDLVSVLCDELRNNKYDIVCMSHLFPKFNDVNKNEINLQQQIIEINRNKIKSVLSLFLFKLHLFKHYITCRELFQFPSLSELEGDKEEENITLPSCILCAPGMGCRERHV